MLLWAPKMTKKGKELIGVMAGGAWMRVDTHFWREGRDSVGLEGGLRYPCFGPKWLMLGPC